MMGNGLMQNGAHGMFLCIFEISTCVHVSKGASGMRRRSSHRVSVAKRHFLNPLTDVCAVNL